MQHQQAERGGLLHVGAGNVELEGGKGVVGIETPEKTCPHCGRISHSNSGQINPADRMVLGGGGGVSVSPQSPSWCPSHELCGWDEPTAES